MRGPGIILALNHENRGDDGLPDEGYVRDFQAKAIGWRCKQLKVRRYTPQQVRNTDREANSLPISLFVFDEAPDDDYGEPFECVGVRIARVRGTRALVSRAVYLLVLDVDVVDLESRLGADDDMNLQVLLSFRKIKEAGRQAGSWMRGQLDAAVPQGNHQTLRPFRSVIQTIQRIFGATSRREIRDWNHVSGSRAG
jgi:hypothetical protein